MTQHSEETQIALIHRDLKAINEKIDSLNRALDVVATVDKVVHTHTIELSHLNSEVKENTTDIRALEQRLSALENWRWYVLGIFLALGIFLSGIPWKVVLF